MKIALVQLAIQDNVAKNLDKALEKFEWELRIPAMQNNVFIAMCNRVGVEHEMHFCGESIVVDPNGDVLAKADDTEQILYADIDFDVIPTSREARPYLGLRRPEFYTLPSVENKYDRRKI